MRWKNASVRCILGAVRGELKLPTVKEISKSNGPPASPIEPPSVMSSMQTPYTLPTGIAQFWLNVVDGDDCSIVMAVSEKKRLMDVDGDVGYMMWVYKHIKRRGGAGWVDGWMDLTIKCSTNSRT